MGKKRLLVKMMAQRDMAHLFTQPHQNYNQNIEQPHSELSEIELNGSVTTTELKKPHPASLVGGVQTWNGWFPHPLVVGENLGGISQE